MRSRANTAVNNSMSTPVLQAPDSPDTGLRRERAAIAAQACQTCRNRYCFLPYVPQHHCATLLTALQKVKM